MYLRSRGTEGEFDRILSKNRHKFPEGVVHWFYDTETEMKRLLDMGIYLGVNGCLLKQENAFEIIRNIPVEKLIIETNSPGCGIPNPWLHKDKLMPKPYKWVLKSNGF